MAKRLEMIFKDAANKTMKISVDNVRDNLTDLEVRDAMQTIISKNIFATEGGSLTAIDSARIVDTNTQMLNV